MVFRQNRFARAVTQFVYALFHDADRLAHLFDAAQVTVPAVAVLADDDLELHVLIAVVRHGLTDIPRDVRTTQHNAREAPSQRLFFRHNADVDVTLFKDTVFGDQAFDIVQGAREFLAPDIDVVDQLRRQVLMDAAWTEIVSVQTRTTSALTEDHQLLALFVAP